ncbi:MAG: STAS domain-containing protein [Rectinemataceae bacterium]
MNHGASPEVLSLVPSLTIDKAAELKTKISKALEGSDLIHLELSKVEDLDLACLQLIYAARSAARAAGKRIVLVGNPSPHVMKRLAAAGFLRSNPGAEAGPLETALINV